MGSHGGKESLAGQLNGRIGYPVLQNDRIIVSQMNLFMSATWKSRKNYQIWMMLLHI